MKLLIALLFALLSLSTQAATFTDNSCSSLSLTSKSGDVITLNCGHVVVPPAPPAGPTDYVVQASTWPNGGLGNYRLEIPFCKARVTVAFTSKPTLGKYSGVNLQVSMGGFDTMHTATLEGRSMQSHSPTLSFSTGPAPRPSFIQLAPNTQYVLIIDTPNCAGPFHLNFQNVNI